MRNLNQLMVSLDTDDRSSNHILKASYSIDRLKNQKGSRKNKFIRVDALTVNEKENEFNSHKEIETSFSTRRTEYTMRNNLN